MNTVQRVNTPSQRVVPPPRPKAKPPATKPRGATAKQQQQPKASKQQQPKASKGWFGWGGPTKKELALQKQIERLQSEIKQLQARNHQATNTKIDNLEIQAVRAQFTIQKLEKDLYQQRNSLLKKVKRLRQENEKAKAKLATELQIKDVDMQTQAKKMESLQEALTKETTINKLKILHLESSLQYVENERKKEHDQHQQQIKKLQYQLQVRDQLLTEKEECIQRLEAAHPARARIARLEMNNKKKNTKNVQQLKQQKDSHQVALQNSLRHLRSSKTSTTTNQKADVQTTNQLRRELVETKKKLLAAQKRIRSLLGQKQQQPKNGEPPDACLKDLYDTKVRLKKALDRIYELEHC